MIKQKNNGYVLISGLILLLIITVIALSGTANSILHERLAGGLQDKQVAVQNAESALRVAESYIYANVDNTSAFAADCAGGLCTASSIAPVWQGIDWINDTTHTFTLTGANIIPKTLRQPKYIIELLDEVPAPPGESAKVSSTKIGANAYRVTTVAFGNGIDTQVMLQSIFVKR